MPPFPYPTGAPCLLQITVDSTLVAGAIARPAPEMCIDGSSDEGENGVSSSDKGGNLVGSSDETVTKRPRAAVTKRSRARPDDHEAPLCPSGHLSSKPARDPSVSPSAPKRAKLASSPRVEVALLPASSDSSASERQTSPEWKGKRRDDGKGRGKRPRSPNSGDEKLAKVAKSQTPSSPGQASQSVVTAATVKAVEAELSPCGLKADSSGAASGGGGDGCSTVAESSSGEGTEGASPGPSVLLIEAEEDVGPARVPTEVEKIRLAIMSREATTVPLRLDARER